MDETRFLIALISLWSSGYVFGLNSYLKNKKTGSLIAILLVLASLIFIFCK